MYVDALDASSRPHYVVPLRDKLDRANLKLHRSWDLGEWKESSWMAPYIKFGVNPKFLTFSYLAHKFNGLILIKEKNLTINPTVQSIRISENSIDPMYFRGSHVC